jgi:nucleoside-diphosphate-sugar epimerase
MKAVITGGTGFIGLRLAQRLLERGALVAPSGREEPIDQLVLFDAVAPRSLPAGLDGRVEVVAGDIADPGEVAALVDRDDCSVFHLASVLSGGAEQDFDLALRVNLHGGLNALEACRARTGQPRLVLASTYAAFGGDELPETVSDLTKLTPETTYGTTKAILELLVNDYTRKGFLDGRSARLPTVIVRPGQPNLAASSWVSAVFREPLAGQECVLPVGLDMRTPVGGVRTVVEGLVRLHDADPTALGHDRGVTFPSISVTAGEMVECVRRAGEGRALGHIEVRPDPIIEAICGSWAKRADFGRALRLGLPVDESLDAIVRAYVEDYDV